MKSRRERLLGRTIGNVTHLAGSDIDDAISDHIRDKGLLGSIGRRIMRIGRRAEPFDPKAEDGDGDGMVQDGTPWERPLRPRIPFSQRHERRNGARKLPSRNDVEIALDDLLPEHSNDNLAPRDRFYGGQVDVTPRSVRQTWLDVERHVERKFGKITNEEEARNALRKAFPNLAFHKDHTWRHRDKNTIDDGEKGALYGLLYMSAFSPKTRNAVVRLHLFDDEPTPRGGRQNGSAGLIIRDIDQGLEEPIMGISIKLRRKPSAVEFDASSTNFKPANKAIKQIMDEPNSGTEWERLKTMQTAFHEYAHALHFMNMSPVDRDEKNLLTPAERYKQFWNGFNSDMRARAWSLAQIQRMHENFRKDIEYAKVENYVRINKLLMDLWQLWASDMAKDLNPKIEKAFAKMFEDRLQLIDRKIAEIDSSLSGREQRKFREMISDINELRKEYDKYIGEAKDIEQLFDRLRHNALEFSEGSSDGQKNNTTRDAVKGTLLALHRLNAVASSLDDLDLSQMEALVGDLENNTSGYAYGFYKNVGVMGNLEAFAELIARKMAGSGEFSSALQELIRWGTKAAKKSGPPAELFETSQLGEIIDDELILCGGYFDYPATRSEASTSELSKKALFDPHAEDGDGDGMVQDGTIFQRPATPAIRRPHRRRSIASRIMDDDMLGEDMMDEDAGPPRRPKKIIDSQIRDQDALDFEKRGGIARRGKRREYIPTDKYPMSDRARQTINSNKRELRPRFAEIGDGLRQNEEETYKLEPKYKIPGMIKDNLRREQKQLIELRKKLYEGERGNPDFDTTPEFDELTAEIARRELLIDFWNKWYRDALKRYPSNEVGNATADDVALDEAIRVEDQLDKAHENSMQAATESWRKMLAEDGKDETIAKMQRIADGLQKMIDKVTRDLDDAQNADRRIDQVKLGRKRARLKRRWNAMLDFIDFLDATPDL